MLDRYHVVDRRSVVSPGTHPKNSGIRRAFSVLEVAVAVAIIGLISGMITLAVTQAQMTSGNNRLERQVRSVVGSMVDQVAGAPYAQLAQGSFVRPEACPDDAKRTCTTVWGRDIQVAWSTTLSTSPDRVTITAVTETVKNRTITLHRIVAAPAAGWAEGNVSVRVTVSGDGYTGHLYVADRAGSVIGDGTIENGIALISVPDASCTSKYPCRLALSPAGGAVSGVWGLDPVTVLGSGGYIVTSEGTTDVSAVVTRDDRVVVKLRATNPDGRQAAPSVAGSVCLSAIFNDGVGSRRVQKCNDTLPDRIVFSSYRPDPARPELSLALPRGAVVSFGVDGNSGTCPMVEGAKVFIDGEWQESGSECTSWTWGTPSTIVVGSTESALNAFAHGVNGETVLTAVWAGSSARPATGYEGQSIWAKPRDARACAVSSGCVAQSAPEPTQCPGQHCRSSAHSGPQLVSLLTGSRNIYSVQGTAGTENAFVLAVNSSDVGDDDTTVVELVTAPSAGSVKLSTGTTLVAGATVASFTGSDHSIPLVWAAPGSASATSIRLRLSNTNGSTDVNVSLSTIIAPWLVEAEPLDLAQGMTGTSSVTVIGTDGELFTGATVAGTGPSGVTVGTGVTGSTGTAEISVGVGSASAGTSTISFSASATVSGVQRTRTGSGILFVRSSAARLTITPTSVGTNGSGSVLVAAVDAVGNPARSTTVEFAVSRNGAAVTNVHARPGGCVTDTSGICSVLLVADPGALPAVYDLLATSGSTSDTGLFTVAASARSITVGRASVAQGGSSKVTVTVSDAAGSPLSGQTVTLTTPTGLTASVSGTTDNLGRAVVTITATNAATIGPNTISVSSGGAEQVGNVNVTAKITSIRWKDGTMSVPTGSVVSVSLTAYDGADQPAASVSLSLIPDGIVVPSVVRTDRAGVASFTISVSAAAPAGQRSFAVSYDGSTVDVVTVNVVKGVGKVLATNTLQASGVTQNLNLRLTDNAGGALSGVSMSLLSTTKGLTLGKTTVKSGADGMVTVPVTVRSDLAGSTSRVTVTIYGRDYPVAVPVKG